MAVRPRVLVVGAGHAGLAAVHAVLSRMPEARVVLFEPSDVHLLKPRLHEALVDDFPIELPLAPLLKSPRVEHVRAAVTAVDAPDATVVARKKRWSGDFLIVAAGARTRMPNAERAKKKRDAPATFRLDGMPDVIALRKHLEACVRQAAGKVSAAKRRSLLSVLVVGGGYTGVETSAEMALLLRRLSLAAGISPALVHVTICETRERLFAGVPDDELAQRVHEGLSRKAVDVRTGEEVRFQGGVPIVSGRATNAATVLLATGIEGVLDPKAPFVARAARWKVDESLRVPSTAGIFAIGDGAVVPTADGPVAPSAQHAVQEGRHAAANIAALVKGKALTPFRPSTLGEFLTLGDGDVVGWVQIAGRRLHLSGVTAATARAAAFARYLAGLKLGARVR